eukprot:scpid84644/ scgid12752/ 
MGDVPAWKKAILEKKKQKDEQDERKRKEDEAKLSQLPAWKRSLLLRKQEQDTSSGKASPPLSRSGFAAKRKDSLLREHENERKQVGSEEKASAPASAPVTNSKPLGATSQASAAPAARVSTTSSPPAVDTSARDRASSVGSDDGTGEDGRPKTNVKQLLGMFGKQKSKEQDSSSSTPAAKGPATVEKKRPGSLSSPVTPTPPAATKSPASSAQSQLASSQATQPSQKDTRRSTLSRPPASKDKPDGGLPMSLGSIGGGEEEEDDVVTNIDDIVLDATKVSAYQSPKRLAGVESLPTSPSRVKKTGSILISHPRALAKGNRAVSFDEINLETVHTFERTTSSDEEEEEEEEVPDRGPPAPGSGGLRSVPSIATQKGGGSGAVSGFQAFQPKSLSDKAEEPAAADVEVPSWRQQAAATPTKKAEPKVDDTPDMARQADLVVEDIEDAPALLW